MWTQLLSDIISSPADTGTRDATPGVPLPFTLLASLSHVCSHGYDLAIFNSVCLSASLFRLSSGRRNHHSYHPSKPQNWSSGSKGVIYGNLKTGHCILGFVGYFLLPAFLSDWCSDICCNVGCSWDSHPIHGSGANWHSYIFALHLPSPLLTPQMEFCSYYPIWQMNDWRVGHTRVTIGYGGLRQVVATERKKVVQAVFLVTLWDHFTTDIPLIASKRTTSVRWTQLILQISSVDRKNVCHRPQATPRSLAAYMRHLCDYPRSV